MSSKEEIEGLIRQLAEARAVLASLEYETNREQEKLMDDNQRLRAERDKARTESLEARMALRDTEAKLAKAIEAIGEMFEFWREHDGGDSAELWIKEWVTKHADLKA